MALTENFKDTSIKANNATNQSNFAGTKYWSGGSSTISNYAGTDRCAGLGTSGTGGKPSRHPEGVKGGNSDFKFGGSGQY
jgi:hypothetical protein